MSWQLIAQQRLNTDRDLPGHISEYARVRSLYLLRFPGRHHRCCHGELIAAGETYTDDFWYLCLDCDRDTIGNAGYMVGSTG